jgi:hypothetical protein
MIMKCDVCTPVEAIQIREEGEVISEISGMLMCQFLNVHVNYCKIFCDV